MATKKELEKEIKKLKREIKKLFLFAYKDELTGLFNRRGFKEEVSRFLGELQRKNEKRKSVSIKDLGLIIFDIDDFKKINDLYGHQYGDKILKKVASIIKSQIRKIDIPARWGGEEIVIALIGADEEDSYQVAERIRKLVKEETKVTLSGGVGSFKKIGNFEKLFELCDKALYQAKKKGKDKVIKISQLKK